MLVKTQTKTVITVVHKHPQTDFWKGSFDVDWSYLLFHFLPTIKGQSIISQIFCVTSSLQSLKKVLPN